MERIYLCLEMLKKIVLMSLVCTCLSDVKITCAGACTCVCTYGQVILVPANAKENRVKHD